MSRNILTKDEYSSLFCTGDFIKSECYIDYITERLAELNQCYEGREIPLIIIDRINQLYND